MMRTSAIGRSRLAFVLVIITALLAGCNSDSRATANLFLDIPQTFSLEPEEKPSPVYVVRLPFRSVEDARNFQADGIKGIALFHPPGLTDTEKKVLPIDDREIALSEDGSYITFRVHGTAETIRCGDKDGNVLAVNRTGATAEPVSVRCAYTILRVDWADGLSKEYLVTIYPPPPGMD